jgi:hypothetical protein
MKTYVRYYTFILTWTSCIYYELQKRREILHQIYKCGSSKHFYNVDKENVLKFVLGMLCCSKSGYSKVMFGNNILIVQRAPSVDVMFV